MAQFYFDCSSATDVLLDRRGRRIDDLAEARAHAARLVQDLISAPGHEDWRDWVMHVSDEEGVEIFDVPFSSLLGKPH
jgi:hypothetical protein